MPSGLLIRLRGAVKVIRPSVETNASRLVVIVAGEASGDLHGSNLVRAMKSQDPDIVFIGIGGEKMQKAGVEILFSSSDMAVVGLTEVFFRLRIVLNAFRKIKSILKNSHPDLIILIDYPGFNIHMAGIAKRLRVPVLYYISPQVWAWRTGRVKKIARRVDRLAVILPFEEDFYRERGVNVDYVGHPLLDCISDAGADIPDGGLTHPVIGLLPGSRKEEVTRLLPVMMKSAEILARGYPELQCLLALAPTIDFELVQSLIAKSSVRIKIIRDEIYGVLSSCDIAIVTSGTATLETAIIGIPMVIVYSVSPITYWGGRIVIKVPYIGLANLVAGENVVPEVIQNEVTPERLAHEVDVILEDEIVRGNMIRRLKEIKGRLGSGGASERTAEIAFEIMSPSR